MSLEHPDTLAAASREVLALVGERSWSEDFYLAGSAALALHIGHRPVRGLDLMTPTNRLTGPERRDLLEDLLAAEPQVRVETARDGYLFVRFPEEPHGGVGLRLYYYPYPLIAPFEESSGVEVASLLDLGLMKLGAIISRGTRRDFVDLYLLCRKIPLAELLERAPEKFGHVRDFPLQALKGLADLSLVDGEPMPRLSDPLEWSRVAAWLRQEVRTLGRQQARLDPVTEERREGEG